MTSSRLPSWLDGTIRLSRISRTSKLHAVKPRVYATGVGVFGRTRWSSGCTALKDWQGPPSTVDVELAGFDLDRLCRVCGGQVRRHLAFVPDTLGPPARFVLLPDAHVDPPWSGTDAAALADEAVLRAASGLGRTVRHHDPVVLALPGDLADPDRWPGVRTVDLGPVGDAPDPVGLAVTASAMLGPGDDTDDARAALDAAMALAAA